MTEQRDYSMPTVPVYEPLQCSQGGVPFNKAHLDARDAVIEDLRKSLAFVKAQRDHWHALVPIGDRVKFPFDPKNH